MKLSLVLAAVVLVVLGVVAAVAPLRVLSAVTPGGGQTERRDIAYGDGPRHRLDVYRPQGEGARPVVIFFYGGAWQEGERAQYRFVGRALARAGFVAVLPDYRVHPEVRWPAFLQDGAAAVRWVREHAAELGGDPGRIFLMGHSAGAYNAAMLALDRRWLGAAGLDPARDVAGWIGLSGPYDFLPIVDPVVQTIFGAREAWPVTQPIAYVTAGAPPALLLHGTGDTRVRPGNSERLAARLRAAGVPARLATYPDLGHADTLIALAPLFASRAPVLEAVTAFIGGRSTP